MLVGEAKINADYTYKLDERSEKSDWVYNSLNLGVDCGDVCGTVYAELMGGYGAERDNVVYVHGKEETEKTISKTDSQLIGMIDLMKKFWNL